MNRRSFWQRFLPTDETQIAAEFLVATWNRVASAVPDKLRYARHEPKLTELLCFYLNQFRAESRLTGFWVNEGQELRFSDDGDLVRIKKDITYYSNKTSNRLELIFEFKKLAPSSLAVYRGKDGMRRFTDGNYAAQQPLAIMVGILKCSAGNVVEALTKSLEQSSVQKDLQLVPDGDGRHVRHPSKRIPACAEFDTEHRRPRHLALPSGTILISHIFINCQM